jgi:uncharacterized membrane protein (DUF485 family)
MTKIINWLSKRIDEMSQQGYWYFVLITAWCIGWIIADIATGGWPWAIGLAIIYIPFVIAFYRKIRKKKS